MHGEFASFGRPEFRCPNSQCRKSAEGNGFRRHAKLLEHLRKKSCKPDRRSTKASHRLASSGPPTLRLTYPVRPYGPEHNGANATGSSGIGREDASETPSDETSGPESASAVPLLGVRTLVTPSQLERESSSQQLQRGTSSAGGLADGRPTVFERIGFYEKCHEADVEELRVADKEIQAMEEALQAKRLARQQVEERVANSKRTLEMYKRQLGGSLPGADGTAIY